MYIPISESWITTKFLIDFSSLTSFEQIVIILLANILFFISFKFFYSIFKDVLRSIFRTFRGIIK